MKGLAIAGLLSAVCSAFRQNVKSDAEKDGQALAQQMVAKLKGISPTDWFGIVEKAYAANRYPDDAQKYDYRRVFESAYQVAYTELGSKGS